MTKYESANMSTISLTKVLTIGHAVTDNHVAPHHHGAWWPSQRGQVIYTWSLGQRQIQANLLLCKHGQHIWRLTFSLILTAPNILVNKQSPVVYCAELLTIDVIGKNNDNIGKNNE